MKVVQFTGGKRCSECEEQIEPARLRVQPSARLCVDCQMDRERRRHRLLSCLGDRDIAIIKG
jgi:RNA polymerase-binding transcription factor DksA